MLLRAFGELGGDPARLDLWYEGLLRPGEGLERSIHTGQKIWRRGAIMRVHRRIEGSHRRDILTALDRFGAGEVVTSLGIYGSAFQVDYGMEAPAGLQDPANLIGRAQTVSVFKSELAGDECN